jgi:hypothetical protein
VDAAGIDWPDLRLPVPVGIVRYSDPDDPREADNTLNQYLVLVQRRDNTGTAAMCAATTITAPLTCPA